MSPPRRPFDPNPPGRLPATMIKVMAAEISDPNRLNRGKRYFADDAVTDITVGRGVATAEVQGSRRDPYVVTLEAESGRGVPRRNEVWVSCTCPDDTGTGRDACKHAVAGLLALANEIAIDPELLERWRSGRRGHTPAGGVTRTEPDEGETPFLDAGLDDHDDDDDDGSSNVIQFPGTFTEPATAIDDGTTQSRLSARRRRRLGLPDPSDLIADEDSDAAESAPKSADVIGPMLQAPGGAAAPEFPSLEPLEHPAVRDGMLNDVLADALDQLRIYWD